MASSRHVEVIPNSKRELDSQGDESDEKRRPLLLDSVDSGDDPDAPSSARLEPSGGVAPSPKKSRSNSTIPISKQINPSFGYAAIRSRLRSVLHHPYGLPLAWFLNKENEPCSGATREVSDKVDTAEHQRGWGDGGDGAGEGGSEARDQIGEAFGFATGPTPRTSENDSVISPSLLGNDTSQEQKIMATKTTFPRKEGDDLDMKAPGELSGDSHVEPLAKKESPHGKRDGNHVAENARDASTEAAAAEAIEYGDLEREAPIKTDIDYEVTLRKHFAPLVSALEATGNDKDLNGTEEVLARSFPAGLVPAEKDITKGLVSQMRSIVTKLGLEVKHEPRILNARVETPPYGKPDIVLVRSDCNSGTDTVMLLEVGLNNVHWWSKVHQGVMYLGDMLNCEQKKGIRFSGPALFAVLTIEPTESKEFNSGRLGVFLVTPKTTPSAEGDVKDFRVCLLSRFETSQETIGASTPAERQVELSRVFGRLLRASCKLPALDAASIDFEYLGPNCSRIGDKVLRSFDSRFHLAVRRPDVYLYAGVIENVVVVLLMYDENYEDRPAKCHEREWPWKFHGRLLILSVPYHKGRHYAKSLSEYIPLVKKLKALHESGFVHGDIRCFNIVFSEKDSHFIDYDLGGKTDDKGDGPPYPIGYVFSLRDGMRRGTEGEAIRDVHDWLQLRIPGELCMKPETKDGTIKALEELFANCKNDSGWQIDASDQLQTALIEAGFGFPTSDERARGTSANVSANATGSPKKQ